MQWNPQLTGFRRGLAVQDAEKVAIPHICLFSQKDGDAELVKKYKEALKAKKDVEIEDYTNMLHGWMGARGFYSGEESVKGFERGFVDILSSSPRMNDWLTFYLGMPN